MDSGKTGPSTSKKTRQARLLGWTVLGVSAGLWAAVVVVPFLPLPGVRKAWTAGALAVAGEVAFWVAAVVLGREVVRRYRNFSNPRNWFREKRR